MKQPIGTTRECLARPGFRELLLSNEMVDQTEKQASITTRQALQMASNLLSILNVNRPRGHRQKLVSKPGKLGLSHGVFASYIETSLAGFVADTD
jgi:hypothetical protein